MAGAMLLAVALGSMPAHAQDNANKKDEGDNDIIVTAQFRQQKLQDTPLAITAVSGNLLEQRSQTQLAQVTAQIPSLQLQPSPAGYGNAMSAFIRGIGQADIHPALEPGVGIYVDDVYFGTLTASLFDLLDLDRVEVLRGPQGTLAGMNSEAGALKLYSKKPTGEGGYIEATVGGYHRTDFKGSADFALVPDVLSARISGVYRKRDGFVTRLDYACSHPNDPYVLSGALKSLATGPGCKLGELGDQDMKALRGALRWTPNSRLEVNLVGDYTKDNSQTQATTLLQAAFGSYSPARSLAYQGVPYDNRFVPYGQYRGDTVYNNPYITYANFYDPGVTWSAKDVTGAPDKPNGPFIAQSASQVDGWGVSGTVDYQLNDNLSLKSITAYRHYSSLAGDDTDGSPVAWIQEQQLFTHKQFSEEMRLNGVLANGRVHFTLGGIYYFQRTNYFIKNDTPFIPFGTPDKPTFAFIADPPIVMDQVAGFGNISVEATDKLTFEGGIRVTHEKKTLTFNTLTFDGSGRNFDPLSNPADPLTGLSSTFEGTIVDYRAVASYKFTPDIMGYAQFSTGFKGGGISPRPYFPTQALPFGPENVRAYEVGLKTDLFDRRLRLNGNVYYMDYIGYQGTPDVCIGTNGQPLSGIAGLPGLCGEYINLGDAYAKGVEVEATARLAPGLTIDGSLSLNDLKFKQPRYSTTNVVAGASPAGFGEFKWSLGMQYDADFGDAGMLSPRIDISHTPGYCGRIKCDLAIANVDSYDLVNARLTYRSADRNWNVSLEVTNLFNKLYYYNKVVTAYASAQPGAPRQWAVTVRRKF